MGLDMYLTKKTYVGANYEHNEVAGEIKLFKKDYELPIELNRVSYVDEHVGYWRKANHIHDWFVQNAQGGEDNCKPHYVSIEQLEELLEYCKEVVKNPEVAESILPTKKGFFFGNTEYNEYYLEDCKYTIELIEGLLKEDNTHSDYEYCSSW
jgi:hypothetical protein